VFDNDFPALSAESSSSSSLSDLDHNQNCLTDPVKSNRFDFFRAQPAFGKCRVVCLHPKSSVTLASMSREQITGVIRTWIDEFNELKSRFDHVQVFENKGKVMGCSNSHPHCQIWASNFIPPEIVKKDTNQRSYLQQFGSQMLRDYAHQELELDERVVLRNDHFAVITPFWACWPFEVIILPIARNIRRLDELSDVEVDSCAEIMRQLLRKYDALFQTSFPYSMGWHGNYGSFTFRTTRVIPRS
jgi:UDPglucose--hexose-1-phosphate uridylyltransferase